jgi:hypothetical protein
MRIMANAIVVSAFVLICAGISASNLADSQTPLAALQMKVEQARPRDKCYLYAELVSRMTDLAGQQLHSSDSAQAGETLMQVQQYAAKIHSSLADDSKKVKDAELIVRRTSFRLQDILHEASYEERPVLETTLKQLNQVRAQLLMQVFKR